MKIMVSIPASPGAQNTRFSDRGHGSVLRGFTLIEILVVVVVSMMVLFAMYAFFRSGVRSTVKGQDTLDSIRAASVLFSQLRKDLLACKNIDTGTASLTIGVGVGLPPTLPFADSITFSHRNATMTYKFLVSAGRGFVQREEYRPNAAPLVRDFAVPRMKKFEALQIWKKHKPVATSVHYMVSNQVLIRIEIDSQDPRFPTKSVHLSSFFTSNQKTSSDWWNYFYD